MGPYSKSYVYMMIDLVSSVLMLASVFYSQPSAGTSASGNAAPQFQIEVSKPKSTEEAVREYFKDTPILIEVARCESTFRQTNSAGSVIRGKVNEYDVGVMQINELYHAETAEEMGLDLHSLEGNLEYAKYLYEKQKLAPWKSSAKCWQAPKVITQA